ncbi:CoA-transferase [Hyphomicrobiales bacterium]|nr:CoA-transferase [Hyphomicrobiales bacterium]CAH1690548.1 CoA-transferase [Hyphomicrobiales bacterium]
MTLPLAGIRVLDVSQVMAGPFCCMLLGDMGADVIKIEPPGTGDQTRKAMGFRLLSDDSPGFFALNRNKRSIEIDLKSDQGREVFYRLVESADILVENNRPGVTKRLKIDYDTLAHINPRLIYASISGFGQTGPWSQRPGFDLIAQAMSGVLSATGLPGAEPVKCGVPIADLGSGMLALYGILSAYIGRQASGLGQHVDASLFETALGLSIWEVTEYWGTGRTPQPLGTANRMSAPYQALRASDGYFVVGAANQKLWTSLCSVIARPELVDDPRFGNNVGRLRHRLELIDEIEPVFMTRPAAEWVDRLLAAGVPAAPVFDFAQALAADHTLERNMVVEIEHPIEGRIKSLGFPVKMSGTPQQLRHPPPILGQHTEEILREIGLSPDHLRDRQKSGASTT